MSELSSGGDDGGQALVSSSADEQDSKSILDDLSGSGQASVQECSGSSREELPTEKDGDGSTEPASHDDKEINEPHLKVDIEPPPQLGKHMSQAALRLQKVYRSFRTRRQLADCAVIVEQKWWKVLDLAELKRSSISFFDYDKHESVLSKWSRARTRAAKVGKGLSKDEKARKLALQHWLEAIDPRHRYGHNLQFYYVKWLHCESTQPFFYWLDIGDGRDTDLERCSRLKLQQQCIKYLGPKEREDYQVVVEKGRFFYKKSEAVLDTMNSPQGTKWIFVLCTSKALYVGKKVKGHFQHSSFLAGGATLSAGRLVVEDGFLKAVWPHSGHYLPTEENFLAFMSFLVEHHVDLTYVQKSPMEEEEDNTCMKEMALMAQNQHNKEQPPSDKPPDTESNQRTQPQPDSETIEQQQEQQNPPTPSPDPLQHPTLPKLKIPHKNDDVPPHTTPFHDVVPLPDDSSPSGYETAEDPLISELDFLCPKTNIFDDDDEEEFKDAIPQETIQRRINTHRRTKSYQLAEQLSFKWTTGVGPRIGCLRDYPSKLQFQAMEHVNLSPRGVKCMNSPGTAALGIKRDLFKLKSPLEGSMPFPSPLGSAVEFATPPSADVAVKDPFEE